MASPLVWDFKIRGAGEASRQLQEVSNSTARAKSSTTEYARELRSQAREANAVIRQDEYRARIMIANSPALRNMVQITGMLNSVLRTTVAVQNMWNTAMLLSKGASDSQIENADELAREQAKLNDMTTKGLQSTVQYQEQQEKVNDLNAKGKKLAEDNANAQLNSSMNFATGAVLIGSTIAQLIPKMVAMASSAVVMGVTYDGALASMTTATTVFGITSEAVMAAVPWLALAAAIAIVAVLIVTHWDEVVGFFNTYLIPAFTKVGEVFASVGRWIAENWRTLAIVLTGGIGALAVAIIDHWDEIVAAMTGAWASLKAGFVAFWNGFASIANSAISAITGGIQGFVNSAIDAINVLISAYNAAARLVGAGGLSYIGHITLAPPQIPMIKAAAGFDGIVSSPTLFMAGEAGQSERVQIGTGSGRSNSPNVVIHNHIQGSVVTERQIKDMVLKGLRDSLRDRGFGMD